MAGEAARREGRRGARYRANVAARAIAGTLGAYAVAATFAFAGARWWPGEAVQAALPPTLLAFLVMPGATLWAFLARSPGRAWGGIVAVIALCALAGWIAGPRG